MTDSVSLKEHFDALREADQRALDLALKAENDKRDILERAHDRALKLAADVMAEWKRDHNDVMKSFAERERKFFPTTLGYVATILAIGAGIVSILTYVK